MHILPSTLCIYNEKSPMECRSPPFSILSGKAWKI